MPGGASGGRLAAAVGERGGSAEGRGGPPAAAVPVGVEGLEELSVAPLELLEGRVGKWWRVRGRPALRDLDVSPLDRLGHPAQEPLRVLAGHVLERPVDPVEARVEAHEIARDGK